MTHPTVCQAAGARGPGGSSMLPRLFLLLLGPDMERQLARPPGGALQDQAVLALGELRQLQRRLLDAAHDAERGEPLGLAGPAALEADQHRLARRVDRQRELQAVV